MMINHRDTEAQRKNPIIVFCYVLSLCLCVSVVNLQAQSRATQTIDQMLEALGGQAFADVKDIHTAGRFFGFTRGELSSQDVFSDYVKFPDMERVEFGG